MALRVVSMSELRLAVLVESERTRGTVAEVCRRYGISRQTLKGSRTTGRPAVVFDIGITAAPGQQLRSRPQQGGPAAYLGRKWQPCPPTIKLA